MYVKPRDWLETVRKEYLHDFVRRGGAAVKFAVPRGIERGELLGGLRAAAEEEGFAFALVDSATTKIHTVDKLFFEVALQIDWDDLAYSFVSCLLTKYKYELPGDRRDFNVRQVSSLNGCDENELQRHLEQWLTAELLRDYGMCQEFRIAMMRLCQGRLDPADVSPSLGDAVKEWLRGELRLISALKSALIFQKIARHNARYMLFSLAHWLKLAGKSGLVLGIDVSRYAEAARPAEPAGGLHYGVPAALDAYEVLRQFIDATDELEYCFIGVVASPAFLEDGRRGLDSYSALKLRIWDEVHDRKVPNPLSSLVRLSPSEVPR